MTLTQDEISVATVLATFLAVHPLGASLGEIAEYAQAFNPKLDYVYIQSLLARLPHVFQAFCMWRRMAAERDARVVAMLEEIRLKESSTRNNEPSQEEVSETLTLGTLSGSRALLVDQICFPVVLQVRCRWSSSSWASLENVMVQEGRGGGEWASSWDSASQTALGMWGKRTRRANLRRSISTDTLAGSALDSGISVGECRGCWNSSFSGRRSEVGGADSPTAKAGSIACYLTRSLCSGAVCDSTTITEETGEETKSTINLSEGA